MCPFTRPLVFDYCHTNLNTDIHLGKILLRLPQSLNNLSPDQFYAKYGHPRYEPVERIDSQPLPAGVPTYGLVPVWLGKGSEQISLSEASILLTDFGEVDIRLR